MDKILSHVNDNGVMRWLGSQVQENPFSSFCKVFHTALVGLSAWDTMARTGMLHKEIDNFIEIGGARGWLTSEIMKQLSMIAFLMIYASEQVSQNALNFHSSYPGVPDIGDPYWSFDGNGSA